MKGKWSVLLSRLPWLLLLFGVDGFAALLLWMIDAHAFMSLALLIFLVSVGLFAAIFIVLAYKEEKRKKAFGAFLNQPDEVNEEKLLRYTTYSDQEDIKQLALILRNKDSALAGALSELNDYEDYVESWAHEVKTPLSLLVMMLDNRSDEMSPAVYSRLNFIRSGISENVDRMLYYARQKSTVKDYMLEFIDIKDCLMEVLEDYQPLLDEKHFRVNIDVPETYVFTDRRGILFILGQVISNTVKYCQTSPELSIFLKEEENSFRLVLKDNGIGVKACDLPYIFSKGFTGDSEDSRKKATGMGLYLCKKLADDLKLKLEVFSEDGQGFEMTIIFPKVEE